MTLAPLAASPAIIQVHVAAALLALACGIVVLAIAKGTARHRRVGWVFAVAMGITAATSVFITRNGHFSAIHLLTLLTAVSLPYAIVMRRRGNIRAHKKTMIGLFAGLAVAGAFTLVPGRLLHQVTFGQTRAAR